MLPEPADDAITLHYQPLADRGGKIAGFEGLMRWHHHERGTISPEAFIPVFENCGVMLPLSRWALKQACLDAVSWKRPLKVSINLPSVQFQEDDVPTLVAAVLAETGLAPERLELEICEAAITANPERTGLAMQALSAQGVQLAFNDIAGGVTLPFHIRDYPFSTIKIARNLVENVATSAAARSIIHMISLVGHSMNITVAAKGIETPGQLAFVLEQGCDFIQGSFVSGPAPISAFAATTGNVPADFMHGSTCLADGMRLIVPLPSSPQHSVQVRI